MLLVVQLAADAAGSSVSSWCCW